MPVPAVWLLPICATKLPTLTLPWLAQRNCTLEAVDCSSNCAPNADSSGRSLQCNHCRCRMCDFCVAELGDPKRPRRPQAYHATLAHKTTSWHESKQQRRGKHLRRSNATAPEASGKHRDAAWAAGNEMWHSMGVRTSYSIMAVCLTLLILLVILCVTALSNQLTQRSRLRAHPPSRLRASAYPRLALA